MYHQHTPDFLDDIQLGLRSTMWFMHDGAPAHYMQLLDKTLGFCGDCIRTDAQGPTSKICFSNLTTFLAGKLLWSFCLSQICMHAYKCTSMRAHTHTHTHTSFQSLLLSFICTLSFLIYFHRKFQLYLQPPNMLPEYTYLRMPQMDLMQQQACTCMN
jgi:hypothetical protein